MSAGISNFNGFLNDADIMKRAYIFLFAAILACACQKNPVDRVCGSYSFRNGGILEILGSIPPIGDLLPAKDTVFKASLVPESGQMRILPNGEDAVVVTMNVTGESPVVFNGKMADGKVILSPVEREISVHDALGILDMPIDVLASIDGEGTIYGNTVVFEMQYRGTFNSGYVPCQIISSNVNCIATRNE